MDETGEPETILRLTAQIVAAHIEHNSLEADALPGLIEKVYRTLQDVGQAPVEPSKPSPAVPIKQSVKAEPTSWRVAVEWREASTKDAGWREGDMEEEG